MYGEFMSLQSFDLFFVILCSNHLFDRKRISFMLQLIGGGNSSIFDVGCYKNNKFVEFILIGNKIALFYSQSLNQLIYL